MLIAHVLNSSATVNDYDVISTLNFIPGSSIKLVIQLKQPQNKNLRYFTEAGATLTVKLPKTDGTTLDVTMTALADLSMWSGDIDAADTEDLVGGNMTFTLVEGLVTTQGWAQNALAIVITGAC